MDLILADWRHGSSAGSALDLHAGVGLYLDPPHTIWMPPPPQCFRDAVIQFNPLYFFVLQLCNVGGT